MTIETCARETFPVDAETYWQKLCLNLDYQERLYREALGCTRMEVLELKGSYETGQTRRLRFEKPLDAPGPIRKLFGETVTLEEISSFDPKLGQWTFRMLPPLLGDKLDMRGVVSLEKAARGVEHVATHNVTCNVFGIGGLLERFIASQAVEGSADKARFTRRYIAEKGLEVRTSSLALG